MARTEDASSLALIRFPIGPFVEEGSATPGAVASNLRRLAAVPERLAIAVGLLDAKQLDTPYRHEGWTVRQVVHHLADSFVMGSARMRWALTESEPTIKPYDEGRWSQLHDAIHGAIEPSLAIFDGTTARLVALLEAGEPDAWARCFATSDPPRVARE